MGTIQLETKKLKTVVVFALVNLYAIFFSNILVDYDFRKQIYSFLFNAFMSICYWRLAESLAGWKFCDFPD